MIRPICELCKKNESKTALIDTHGKYKYICLGCEEQLFGRACQVCNGDGFFEIGEAERELEDCPYCHGIGVK
ncbi:hypothetical protein [Paenibacillus larvae]|uniref:Uncharacterized protein n=1 Tax=Paenibacillus larvae subsp. larvae TaxID=147375 RepID=A0A2L1U7B2_9BACL|nr:hypothetical protein [Paenibacillus larvae]AVF28805.1 hypothetical protein ERICIII_04801 [Paenibacillus larvae subsp. larvae]MCY9499067.1 hypothetical protein [Paenibacillus larvae]MCY9745356.1 hypothetical protein [Paenibacillus larvae]MCY9750212.1 hypothetical protein [Paenibacillus larvae]MDR5608821.1 hypothetical protein [Paenibacillus larvae]